MIQELFIRNFALLEEVRLSFRPGLNVLTGETGAGKSILIDAIGTVLGGRASADAVRTGAERATVEAIFDLASVPAPAPLKVLLEELGVAQEDDEAGVLILAREVGQNGRSIARINGRAVPVSTLAQVGAFLVDIHGQHEHLSLLRAEAQRDLLDRFGGLMPQREALAQLVREYRSVRAELNAIHRDEREATRRIDLLSFQVEEIQNARLAPGEQETLTHERTLLDNAAKLAQLATAIHERLSGGSEEQPSALDLLGTAAHDLGQLVKIDQQAAPHEQALVEATAQVEELGHTFRAYAESIEFAPERLQQIEERLELIFNLQKKYGDTVEEVLAFGQRAAAELDALVNREQRTADLEARAQALSEQVASAAAAISGARAAAGKRLAAAVARELAALSLRGEFETTLSREPDANGIPLDGQAVRFDESGVDVVEFRFAPNPGEPSKAVARTASGGELSRILLALKAVLSSVDRTPTLIFDEVDAGIGGRSGQVLGEKLARLAQEHQVLCVTHLPQLAAYSDSHFFIAKQVREGRTITTVTGLDPRGVEHELAQMLGGASAAALEQARELVGRAEEWKRHQASDGAGEKPTNGKAEPRRAAAPPAALPPKRPSRQKPQGVPA